MICVNAVHLLLRSHASVIHSMVSQYEADLLQRLVMLKLVCHPGPFRSIR